MSKQLLMGNEAIGLAAIAAGVNVACGYPGTPSTEIIETITRHNPGDVYVEWSTNEKAALEVAAGVSYSGGRVLVTMKQVGMNVAADPFMSLVYVGTEGGFVAVVADDPGPISSQTEQDTRQFAQFAHVPCFDPTSPEDAFDMIAEAFALSEKYKTPVIVRPTTRVNHGCATIEVPHISAGTRHKIAGFEKDPRFVIFPRRSYLGHLEIIERLEKIAAEFEFSRFNKRELYLAGQLADKDAAPSPTSAPTLGIITGGVSDSYTKEALSLLTSALQESHHKLPDFELLNIGTPVPFPTTLVEKFLQGKERVIVFEELEPVLERATREVCGAANLTCDVAGKLTHDTTLAGENTPEEIARQLSKFFGCADVYRTYDERIQAANALDVELPVRPPTLCAGCPHRSSFLAVKEAVGDRKANYAGDIGCYTLGYAKPMEATDTCLCMGAGITVAQGLSLANRLQGQDDTLNFAFIGDSTFFASGLTGVANAVYNNHKICVVVLDNSTTAMTGGQPHPGTGKTLMDGSNSPIKIRPVLEALGVTSIVTADPLDFNAAVEAVSSVMDEPGVSAVIFESPCIQIFKQLEPAYVVQPMCIGCETCIVKTGCPALINTDGVTKIDEKLCFGCDLCSTFCPVNAIQSSRDGMTYEERAALRRVR